jgi:hypothetical protein
MEKGFRAYFLRFLRVEERSSKQHGHPTAAVTFAVASRTWS